MRLRIYRTFTWEPFVPVSEIRLGGDGQIALTPHDELQYLSRTMPAEWTPVPVVEAEKPEHPYDKKRREEIEEFTRGLKKQIENMPPVDRTARTLTDGTPVTDDHRDIQSDGMQKGYVVLSAEERSKGFVRPVRRTYIHKKCGVATTMGLALAETYARDPAFYSGTFCCGCRTHLPLNEFVWDGTDDIVGS